MKIRSEEVTKKFGSVVALDEVTLNIGHGELFTLLGPSGCGKTTFLRAVAGFELVDSGRIFFDDVDVTTLPPHIRKTGLVFQNYALWPHMNVFDNIAYGLKIRKATKREIETRVKEVLEMVRLSGLENRTPHQLSGGQQQRVAVARALVISPEVLLFDEPLSNLDAKLRVQTRVEITKLQKRLGITSVYVTHDQEEALCISDRIAVMHLGRVQQVGTAMEIYERPANPFVADFIGIANLLDGRVASLEIQKGLALVSLSDGSTILSSYDTELNEGSNVYVSFRPEAVDIFEGPTPASRDNTIFGKVRLATYMGDTVRYEVESTSGIIRVDVHNPAGRKIYPEGHDVAMTVPTESVRIIPKRDVVA